MSQRVQGRLDEETWRPVLDAARPYEVSNMGRVRQVLPSGLRPVLAGSYNPDGVHCVGIRGRGRVRISRLVCEAFHGPQPAGLVVTFADQDRTNARADNLSWGSRCQNMKRGEAHHSAKLTEQDVTAIRAEYLRTEDDRCVLAKTYGVSQSTVGSVIRREHWTHL